MQGRENTVTSTAARRAGNVVAGALLVLLVAGLGAIAGCGGGDDSTTYDFPVSAGNGKSKPVHFKKFELALKKADSGACDDKPCTVGGAELLVANTGETLKLKQLDVTLFGKETTKSVTNRFGTSRTADGVFVIFDLKVLNKTGHELFFDGNNEQIALYLAGKGFSEDFDLENFALDSSFVNEVSFIPVDGALRKTVAFDIPQDLVPELDESGNLALLNFNEEGHPETAKQIGIIRTYE
jgi:hypothetical protein